MEIRRGRGQHLVRSGCAEEEALMLAASGCKRFKEVPGVSILLTMRRQLSTLPST